MTNELIRIDAEKIKGYVAEGTEKEKSKNKKVGILDRNTCVKIIETTMEKKNLKEKEIVWMLIVGLVQNGGSNKNAGMTNYTVKEYQLSANEFQDIIQRTAKNGTIRQFCRTMANEIATIAEMMEEPGDLAKQMEIEYSDMTIEEKVWCSNFQTKNPNCPKKIKEWLVKNYNKRFRP